MATSDKICMYCGSSLKTRSGFNKHVKRHEGIAPFTCCGKMFYERGRLQMHRCSAHGAEGEESCEVCGKKFPSRQQVRQHLTLVHTDLKLYKCDICGQVFKSSASLMDHTSKHEGQKTHVCQCGKVYQYASGLYRHKRACKHT